MRGIFRHLLKCNIVFLRPLLGMAYCNIYFAITVFSYLIFLAKDNILCTGRNKKFCCGEEILETIRASSI